MSGELELIARLLAFERGQAQPFATHLRLAIRPDALVVCPIAMAGEDTTVHIVASGRLGTPPMVRCVPDPRFRDDQYRLFAELGAEVEHYFSECRARRVFPQLWVSSAAAAAHLDVLADRLRFNPHDATVKRFGELLTYATERGPIAGQQALQTATGALREHWATGQQVGEDEHLGTLLTWIDPPKGRPVLEAVADAERVQMGVKTDPAFDHDVLEPLVSAYNRARREGASPSDLARRGRLIRDALQPVVLRIYDATQTAVARLRGLGLPPLPDLAELERQENEAFLSFMASRDDGYPLPLRDSPKLAVFKLTAREQAIQNAEAAVLRGDRIGRARARLAGHLLVGTVANPRAVPRRSRGFDYGFDLETNQTALRLRPRDELCSVEDPRLRAVVLAVRRSGRSTVVSLRLSAGQRAVGLPQHGATLELTTSVPDWYRLYRDRKHLGRRLAVTPWTHRQDGIPSAAPRAGLPPDPLAAVEALR